jgi:hypothetical protein
MRNGYTTRLFWMFIVMMATSNMNEYPAFFFEPGDNLMTGHEIIVHTIHIMSISATHQAAPQRTGITHLDDGSREASRFFSRQTSRELGANFSAFARVS